MNFTGQYKKGRTINLGGRNATSTGGTSRQALVKKAQLDRERRERARNVEKAAVIVQNFYISKRLLHQERVHQQSLWDSNYVNAKGELSAEDLQHCIRQFNFFIAKIYDRKQEDRIDRLYSIIVANPRAISQVSKTSLSILLDQLIVILYRNSYTTILKIVGLLFDYANVQILPKLVDFWKNMENHPSSEFANLLWDCIFKLSQKYTDMSIAYTLSIPNLLKFAKDKQQMDIVELSNNSTMDSTAKQALYDLSIGDKIIVTTNLLHVIEASSFSVNALQVLEITLGSICEYFGTIKKDESFDDDDDGEPDYKLPSASVIRDDETITYFEDTLCSRKFISQAYGIFERNYSWDSINILASFYSSLIRIFPNKRRDLLLYLSFVSTSSSAVHLFWKSFQQSQTYQLCIDGIISDSQIRQLSSTELHAWTKLMLAMELYSYWLIVADDKEFLTNERQGLNAQEAKKLAVVLKNLCFSLIWNSNSDNNGIKRLKEVCLVVIRQIYIRDSRRPFVGQDPNFWLMTKHFDMSFFIQSVVEEVQQRGTEESSEVLERTKNRDVMSRMEILKQAPFFMPFDVRVNIFQAFIDMDENQRDRQDRANIFDFYESRQRSIRIRRNNVLEDSFDNFGNGDNFKANDVMRVTFIDEYGNPEAGIDGGGLTKELLSRICKEAFDDRQELFVATGDHRLYPNPALGVESGDEEVYFGNYDRITDDGSKSCRTRQESLRYIQFLGNVIGKCLRNAILVDIEFAPFFLQKCAGTGRRSLYKNSFDDMYLLDPEIYNNLVKLKEYSGDVEDLNLNFTIVQDLGHGRQVSLELKPGGENIAVTNANRLEYVHAIANFKLNVILQQQTQRFFEGVGQMISLDWLSMFNAHELQMLISGGSSRIDLVDLKSNTVYGAYKEDDLTIRYFWQVLEEMSDEDRSMFIKFVTSVPKAPLLGFKMLSPKFAIRNAGANDKDRLPTASTCVNMLKLPDYGNKKLLRDKLMYSIHSGAGFDLS